MYPLTKYLIDAIHRHPFASKILQDTNCYLNLDAVLFASLRLILLIGSIQSKRKHGFDPGLAIGQFNDDLRLDSIRYLSRRALS